jgi:hypothetical protein
MPVWSAAVTRRSFSAVLMVILLWNAAWPMALSIRARLSRPTPSEEHSGAFLGVYAMDDQIIDREGNYVKTPFSIPYVGESARLKLSISPEKVAVSIAMASGHEFTETYAIGHDVFCLGDGSFVFYSSSLNFGQILPGTTYATTACRVEVSPESLSVSAEENQVGLGFFLIPKVQKTTFTKSFPAVSDHLR